MRSAFGRQFAMTAMLLLLSLLILGTGFMGLLYSYLLNETDRALSANADAVVDMAAAYGTTGELAQNWDFQMSLTFASKVSGYDALICDNAGRVILCSCEMLGCEHIGKLVDLSGFTQPAGDRAYRVGTLGEVYAEKRHMTGVPIVSNRSGGSLGYCFVSSGEKQISALLGSLFRIFVMSALAVLMLAFVATWLLARLQAQPLREMAQAAKKFARGDFTVRVQSVGDTDEMGELAHAFNNMASSLEKSETLRREFIGNVSHELKTPMTTITGFVDGILDGTIPEERQRDYLRSVSGEVRRLSRLVRKMLDVARLQSDTGLNLSRFDMSELMRRSLLSFEQKITDRRLGLDIRLGDEPLYVSADYDAITQVVTNLLDNAVKFSDEGGTITLSLTKKGQKARVCIKNTGAEIPEEELPHIFDRFHKSDRSRSMDKDGVGLGLYIVRTILSSHGEDIAVSSEDGATEFSFCLDVSR